MEGKDGFLGGIVFKEIGKDRLFDVCFIIFIGIFEFCNNLGKIMIWEKMIVSLGKIKYCIRKEI